MRYIFYARKSEPDEGRQEKSIEQQRELMLDAAERSGLVVVKQIEESVSAKVPGKRQGYQEMLRWLKQDRADAILVYHANRLARNPLESGEIQQLLQDHVIREIRTHEAIYRPEDNALLLAVISSMANQYSRDLSTTVKRGMNSKRNDGWFPHRAPEGYINNLQLHTIEIDPARFLLLRQAWDMMLTGSYSVPQILARLNDQWGYKTKVTRKMGGSPLSRNGLYNIFTNIFYTGRWQEGDTIYQGKHPPMITVAEFQQVQAILHRNTRTVRQNHTFAYTGMIRCPHCRSMVTAEAQTGRHGRGRYVYYRCSNSHGICRKVSISETALEQQVDALLQRITITPEVKDLALAEIRSWQKNASQSRESLFEQQQKALLEAERKRNKLVEMYLNELFGSDAEYKARQAELQQEINRLQLEVESSAHEFERITQTAENAFQFAAQARNAFLIGDLNTRREIARALGLNYYFAEGTVTIDLHPALAAVCRLRNQMEDSSNPSEKTPLKQHIEPLKRGSESKKDGSFEPSVSFGWPKETLFQTFKQVKESFPGLSWLIE